MSNSFSVVSAAIGGGSSSSSSNLSLDQHHLPPIDQLCYVHCHLCDTVLAVSVPSSSLYKTLTVRCGHCANLLPVTMRGSLPPPPPATSTFHLANHLMEGTMNPGPNISPAPQLSGSTNSTSLASSSRSVITTELPRPPTTNRPPEKRQRVPSAYNRFIKDEIQRIKAGNPNISHREAFSAAAKNWAHFPHICYGLMPDHTAKRTTNMRTHPNPQPQPQEAGDDIRMKNGYFSASARVGVFPY